MESQVAFAFSRMRRTETIADLHSRGRDYERFDQANNQLDADSDTFEKLPAVTARDVALKAKEAVICLDASDYGPVANVVRAFFAKRRTVDGAWLADLRRHIASVKSLTPDCGYAIACLESIAAGQSQLRSVA